MKRLFILASAAIVALASCTKTEVVYNEAPQEIGFKAVTGMITKAEQKSGTLTGDMGVFAFVNGTSDNVYFENKKFTGTTTWTGGQYWPLQSNLNFVVYAPYGTADYTSKVLTVTGVDNSGKTAIDNQTDYLYGVEYYDGDGDKTSGYNSTTGDVATQLKHALAKVTLNFTGENVTVNSVSLENPTLKGQYAVDYTADNPVAVWTATPEATNLTLSDFSEVELSAVSSGVSIMVVPAADSDIIVGYTIKNSSAQLSATIELNSTWDSGTHYTYNISINPNAIEFSAPAVSGWVDGGTTPL